MHASDTWIIHRIGTSCIYVYIVQGGTYLSTSSTLSVNAFFPIGIIHSIGNRYSIRESHNNNTISSNN